VVALASILYFGSLYSHFIISSAVFTSPLSTLHRSLIAFSALHLGYGPRAAVLAAQQVTEADLRRYHTEWQRLQKLRAIERTANRATS
jgi:hypothetical protein